MKNFLERLTFALRKTSIEMTASISSAPLAKRTKADFPAIFWKSFFAEISSGSRKL